MYVFMTTAYNITYEDKDGPTVEKNKVFLIELFIELFLP